jgi:valyl-tRNA synthetase
LCISPKKLLRRDMLEKTYTHADIEQRISKLWQEADAFRAGAARETTRKGKPYCIMLPPPNVTGSLHMGHALNHTLQDILARYHRMKGFDVLWQPGTDHAGIATQMVVERQLAERGEPDRRTLGREEFLKRVWAWKAESGGMIVGQQKRLGESCDWSRQRFTMDEGLSAAVTKVFVELYRKGLIYKDKRLVNWDPKLQTAISDLEVMPVETKGHLWYFRYPLTAKVKGYKADHIVVATTRPETMLGDMAVAVHPKDKRYAALVKAGAKVRLPLVSREIPVIADDYADPEQGSGAVKITPAHDFNDFEVGKRHGLEALNIFTPVAALNGAVPEAYRGMDRFAARKKVVADLEELGLVEKIEPHTLKVPYGDRSNVVIEPYLTDQWYVDAKTLAEPALAAVREGKTRFVPKNWENTYFHWLENIQPWCISRQLWWGHQIPAWYGPDGQFFVGETELEAKRLAKAHYGKAVTLTRDEDVLDTWFSSALWPFSTLGWPDKTPELKRYYPTSVLVTGFDIIFFWVARMMMMGLYFRKEVPFHDVYIHALVRDEKGAKMSKSKGNVIDPLTIIGDYGADALRFTLAAMAAQGRDVKLSTSRIEGYRNFVTKLWNAARFTEMNGCVRKPGFDPAAAKETLNRWIYAETNAAVASVSEAIEAYRFNDAANDVYRFVWNVFCDWYLEFAKPVLFGSDEDAKAETQAMAAWTLDEILKLLHPFMPFVTEELWHVLPKDGAARDGLLCHAAWPKPAKKTDRKSVDEIRWVIGLITEIRSLRAEMNVPAAAQIPLTISGADRVTKKRANQYADFIKRLARLNAIDFADAIPPGSVQFVTEGVSMALPLANVIDLSAERDRLSKEIGKLKAEIEKIDAKLNNEQFISKAPEEVVEENRERRAEAEAAALKLQSALQRIEDVAA